MTGRVVGGFVCEYRTGFRSVNVGAHADNNSDSEKSIKPLQSLAQEYGEHHA